MNDLFGQELLDEIIDETSDGRWRTAVYIAARIFRDYMIDSNDKRYRRVLKILNSGLETGVFECKYKNRYTPKRWRYRTLWVVISQ